MNILNFNGISALIYPSNCRNVDRNLKRNFMTIFMIIYTYLLLCDEIFIHYQLYRRKQLHNERNKLRKSKYRAYMSYAYPLNTYLFNIELTVAYRNNSQCYSQNSQSVMCWCGVKKTIHSFTHPGYSDCSIVEIKLTFQRTALGGSIDYCASTKSSC